jgi:mycothiol synthase
MTDTVATPDTDLPSPDSVAIPGLALRRFGGDADYEALAALITASNTGDDIPYAPAAESLRNEFENLAEFDPRQNVLLAEADGQLVGYGQANRQVRDGVAVYWTFGTVLQAHRRRGLGRLIVRANEQRGREIATAFDDAEGRVFGTWIDDKESGANELFRSEGYEPARYGFAMRRPTLHDVVPVPMPEGLELRPVRPEDHRRIFDADSEAFRDHWGHREPTEEDFVATYSEPELDTSLWRIAWDGDQVAGCVMSYIWRSENEKLGVKRGWLEHISVRRQWRRRGLAKALIASALQGLRDAGMEDAMLGVDTQNLTGALQLYESVGFVVDARSTHYRKPFPAE